MPILLIDDEADIRALLRPVLESMNLRVIEAADGVEGVRLFGARRPRLVIVDIAMPRKDGLETIREIRTIDPSARIIVLSGGPNRRYPDSPAVARQLGAAEILEKPLAPGDLRAAVARQLAQVAGARPPADGAADGPIFRVLVVDEQVLFADAVEHLLASHDRSMRVFKAASMLQALAIAEATADLNLAVVDLRVAGMDGFAGLRRLRERRPDLKVAIIAGEASAETARQAIEAGANGFILKTMAGEAMFHALRLILAGERYIPAEFAGMDRPARDNVAETVALTPHERRVMHELATGKSNKEIARALGVEVTTVTFHLTNLYHKLGVTGRVQAIRQAFELGLLDERRR